MPLKNYTQSIVTLEEFSILGIETRTSNETAQPDIPKLWDKFSRDNIAAKIPGKLTNDTYALYTEYESDHTKPYTLVIGYKVNKDIDVPEGLVLKNIPAAMYAVFKAAGEMPKEIVNTWKQIWGSGMNRTYTGDFELYSEKYSSPQPEADIFVAIK